MSQKLMYICLCFCLFQSCDKATLLPLNELENELAPTFEFSINVANCLNGGNLLHVSMPNPELYDYLWEVNGQHGGHHYETIGCQCVKNATVRVTRLEDGLRVDKSIELTTNCSAINASL